MKTNLEDLSKEITDQIITCFESGGKLLLLGCGGSMAEASHFATEMIGIGCPAIALNDPAVITALINDHNPIEVFSRQIDALGRGGDLIIALSTSGKSPSVLSGIEMANALGFDAIDWPREGRDTQEIQEFQLELIHLVYRKVKEYYFEYCSKETDG